MFGGLTTLLRSLPRWVQKRFFCLSLVIIVGVVQLAPLAWVAPATQAAARTLTVSIVPHTSLVGAGPSLITFGLPLPPGFLTNPEMVVVYDKNHQEVPTRLQSLLNWQAVPPAALQCKELPAATVPGIRSVLVQLSYSFTSASPEPFSITLNDTPRSQVLSGAMAPVRSTWLPVTEGTFVAGDNVMEPNAYALFPPNWLTCSGLGSTLDTTSGSISYMDTYDAGQKNFFHSLLNDWTDPTVLGSSSITPNPEYVVGYKTDYEPWLYDRAQAFYTGYSRTGQLDFLREAVRASNFYMQQLFTVADETTFGLSVRGLFKLKCPDPRVSWPDPKYSYSENLVSTYILTGDPETLSHINDVSVAHKNAFDHYFVNAPQDAAELAFWTERFAAFALLGHVSTYEVTGDPTLLAYIRQGLDAFYQMQTHPALGMEKNGAFNHYVTEGGSEVLNWSPWMSSLLAYSFLKAYAITNDARIPQMLVDLGLAEANMGVFMTDSVADFGPSRVLGARYVAPGYGDYTRWDGTENIPDSAMQHAIDVSYVTALGSYFSTDTGTKNRLSQITIQLLNTHSLILQYFTRPQSVQLGYPIYRNSPPRRYAWWYKNTGAVGTLLGEDTTPPVAQITSPTNNQVINGDFSIQAEASDNMEVVGLQFYLDGQPVGAEFTAAPYTLPYEGALAAGIHILSAHVRDKAGNSSTSASVSFVSNGSQSFQQGVDAYQGTTHLAISNQSGGNGLTQLTGSPKTLYNVSGSSGYEYRQLLRFSDISIPENSYVVAAKLVLHTYAYYPDSQVSGAYLKVPWVATSSDSINWTHRTATDTWNTPGAGGDGTDTIANKSIPMTLQYGDTQVKVDLDKDIVQGWLDTPSSNNGLLFRNLIPDKNIKIYSQDDSDPALRPKLIIYYKSRLSQLALSVSVDKTSATPGETLTYTVTYQNIGDQAVSGATIREPIPDTVDLVSLPAGATLEGNQLLWSVGSIPANNSPQQLTYQIRLR